MMTVLLTLLGSLALSVSAGIAADCYVNILSQPGQVLSFWAKWLYDLRDWYTCADEQTAISQSQQNPYITDSLHDRLTNRQLQLDKRNQTAEYILKPILTCVYCVAGQMGFWLSVYYNLSYHTKFSLVFSLLTAFMAVWFGGAFQAIQKKYFPL